MLARLPRARPGETPANDPPGRVEHGHADARVAREPPRDRDLAAAGRHRASPGRAEEAQRRVDDERPRHRRRAAEVVRGGDPEPPATLGDACLLGSRLARGRREGDRVGTDLTRARLGDRDRPVGPRQRHVDGRGRGHPVRQRLRVTHAVAVRGDLRDGGRQERAGVVEHQGGADGPLAPVRGLVEDGAVERERGRPTAVEGHGADRAESHHRPRELGVRQARAVPGLPAVDRDEDDAPVRQLADGAPRRAGAKLERREPLVRAGDRLAAADELRPTADGVRDPGPARDEVEPRPERGADDGLRRERRPLRARRDQDGAAEGNRHGRSALDDLDDVRREVDAGRDEREREEHRGRRARGGRRGRAVAGGVDGGAPGGGRIVERGERMDGRARPGRAKPDLPDVERPVRQHADARPFRVRAGGEVAVSHEDPAHPPVVEPREVGVDPGGDAVRDPSLHRRHRLAPEDRVVREQRLERREATGPRAGDDVEDDRTVVRELDRSRMGDARPQDGRGRMRVGREDERPSRHDETAARSRSREGSPSDCGQRRGGLVGAPVR